MYRVAQSVTMSAHSVMIDPSNAEYLEVNAGPGWKLLKQWADWPANFVDRLILTAAGHASQIGQEFETEERALCEWLLSTKLPAETELMKRAIEHVKASN